MFVEDLDGVVNGKLLQVFCKKECVNIQIMSIYTMDIYTSVLVFVSVLLLYIMIFAPKCFLPNHDLLWRSACVTCGSAEVTCGRGQVKGATTSLRQVCFITGVCCCMCYSHVCSAAG